MRFLNPKTDFAFKKIFGSQQSKEILIGFLNAILYPTQPVIEDLEILDPYQAPSTQGMKDSFLDIKAQLSGGEIVVIEMQVLNVLGFKKRILYNAAKAFVNQLSSGSNYAELYPVIALTITDFELFFNHKQVISRYQFQEINTQTPYNSHGDLEMVFVELPKFHKSLDQLTSLSDRWIYFLKEAENLTLIPDSLSEPSSLRQALDIANLSALSPEELEIFEHNQMLLHDSRNAVLYAQREGQMEGRVEGRAEGRAEGAQAKAEEIARSLLGRLPLEVISETTGLSIAHLQTLMPQNPSPGS